MGGDGGVLFEGVGVVVGAEGDDADDDDAGGDRVRVDGGAEE